MLTLCFNMWGFLFLRDWWECLEDSNSAGLISSMLLNCFSHVQLCATPWTAAYQAPPSMGFSRQQYWSGVPLPSPISSICSIKCLCAYWLIERKWSVLLMPSLFFVLTSHISDSWPVWSCSSSLKSLLPSYPPCRLCISYLLLCDKPVWNVLA